MPAHRDQKSVGAHRMSHQSSRPQSKPQPQPWQLTQTMLVNRLSDSGKKTHHRKNSLATSSRTPMRSNHAVENAKLHTNRASQPSPAVQGPVPSQKHY